MTPEEEAQRAVMSNGFSVRPVPEIGKNRAPCAHKVRVAAGLATLASRRSAYQREQQGLPIDQCGKRSDFIINGQPMCRPHAGAAALAYLFEREHG